MKENEKADSSTVSLRTLHGRANLGSKGSLTIEHETGSFQVPSSAYNMVLPNDGTELLRDAEYYVFCKVSGMEL